MRRTVHFLQDFDYRPSNDLNTIYAYKAGDIHDVSDECATWAIFLGWAVEVLFEDDQADDDLTDWDA